MRTKWKNSLKNQNKVKKIREKNDTVWLMEMVVVSGCDNASAKP